LPRLKTSDVLNFHYSPRKIYYAHYIAEDAPKF